MPFWTVIFLAGRMAIPQEMYEGADMDGAVGTRRFVHVTFPPLANLNLGCTLLSTIWTLGDFNAIYFVTGGGPALSTHVLPPGPSSCPATTAALGRFLNSDEAPWNLMMASAAIHALPPVVIHYVFRKQMSSGLTMGGVKG